MRVLCPFQNLVGTRQTGNARGVRVIAALLEAGCAVDVVTGNRTYLGIASDSPARQCEGALSLARVPIPPNGGRGREYFAYAKGCWQESSRLPPPNFVLASTPPLPGAGISLVIAARRRVPLLIEVRDLWPAFLIEGGMLKNDLTGRMLEVLELTAYSLASGVVVASPGFVPYFEALGIRDAMVAVTGLDPGFAGPPRVEKNRHLRIAYTGSLNEAYGIGFLLATVHLAKGRRWRFIVAGAGRESNLLENVPGVEYLGPKPRDQIPAILSRADLALNLHADWPLLGTTLTGKLFDYMAAGVPVVDIAGGAMGAMIEHSGIGIRCVRSPEHMVSAIARLEANPSLMEKMAGAGRAALTGFLNANCQARNMAEFVLGKARTGKPVSPRRLLWTLLRCFMRVQRGEVAAALKVAYAGCPSDIAEERMRQWLRGGACHHSAGKLSIPSIL